MYNFPEKIVCNKKEVVIMPFGPSPIDPVKDGIYKQIEKEGVPFSVKPIFLKVPSIKGEVANYTRDYNKHRFYELYVEHLKQIGQGIKPQKTQSSDLFVLDGAVRARYFANVDKRLSKLLDGKCDNDFSSKQAFVELGAFLVMVYLSFFFGVSKYLTDLQSKKKFTKKQNVAISALGDDVDCMKQFSGNVLNALSEANKDNYQHIYREKIEVPFACLFGCEGMFDYEGRLHEYMYDDSVVLRTILNENGLTGKNLAGAMSWRGVKEGNFLYNWASFLHDATDLDDSLSIIESNYYDADRIIPLAKDMYSLGGNYISWPLINTYYNLTDKITKNRLKRESVALVEQKANIEKTCNAALAWARKVVKQMPEKSK